MRYDIAALSSWDVVSRSAAPAPLAMAQKKRARAPAQEQRTGRGSEGSKDRTILAGLANLLELPPDIPPGAVLIKLANQLGCDVAADGTLSVREGSDASRETDDEALHAEVH